MRRPDALTAWRIQQTALRESRSFSAALATLVDEGYRARTGLSSTDARPQDDDGTIRGRTVSAHLPGTTIHAIKRVAVAENRSTSSTLKMLLREALAARDISAAGVDGDQINAA